MGEMKTLQNVYPLITSFAHLEKAYRNARKQKRYRTEVLAFSNDLDSNLLAIQEQLRTGTFQFGPYRRHWIRVPKKRLVMALPFASRIVQWSIYMILNPFYDKLMIEDSFACRENKGALAAATRLQHWLKDVKRKEKQWYVLKLDISKYFYRVDHQTLLDILGMRVKDERLMCLLREIVDCDGERFGLPRFMSPDDVELNDWLPNVGMPIGNLTSQLFANIYLNELDQYCKHSLHIHHYVRYMDDVVILAPDKETANKWRLAIEIFLATRLHLDLNKKTIVCPAKKVEFVGFIVSDKRLRLRKQTTRRIKSAFRGICKRYFAGGLTREEFDRRVASYRGMICHCEADNLRARLNATYFHEKEKAMGDLQMIDTLCMLCEEQSRLIRAMSLRLGELGDTALCNEIAAADEKYKAILGNQSANQLGTGDVPFPYDENSRKV